MSTKKKNSSPLAQIAAGVLILAAITGYYLYEAAGRKAGPAETASEAAAPPPAATGGLSRDLATGPLAAFLIHPAPKPLPGLSFQDGTGNPLTLADWKGRVVLLNLWATWCAPCRKEMPDLSKLEKELGSGEFEVVAISVDRKGAEASAAFLQETGVGNLRLYVEPSTKIVTDVQSAGLPATLLIDRQGRELGRILGPADWASTEAVALIKAALAQK
ncbi:MAG: TlpA family protein disulfide reductase [Aestuariivirga sp.]|uniref:TlpA family protein disulfide reductase n=1 Tax=Aestuariivirga sp. TaxID=2650926 RepID=UPI0025BD3CAD|nr:TlpA disulfide reductase family protein [Aestuariivirga sp.]MCA3561729.1 TlpA family protein disulfide reductase [Aestuariivirga sp.]